MHHEGISGLLIHSLTQYLGAHVIFMNTHTIYPMANMNHTVIRCYTVCRKCAPNRTISSHLQGHWHLNLRKSTAQRAKHSCTWSSNTAISTPACVMWVDVEEFPVIMCVSTVPLWRRRPAWHADVYCLVYCEMLQAGFTLAFIRCEATLSLVSDLLDNWFLRCIHTVYKIFGAVCVVNWTWYMPWIFYHCGIWEFRPNASECIIQNLLLSLISKVCIVTHSLSQRW